MTLFKTMIFAVITLMGARCVAQGANNDEARFSRAIALVESNDRLAAKQMFDQIADAELIQDGLAFLRKNSVLSDTVREHCFELLATRGAAKTEEGFRLFIDGLLDPSVQRWSVAGLAYVPAERRRETVRHFVRVSTLADVCAPDDVIRKALGILQRWGEAAEAALPYVEQAFHSSQCSNQARSLAAKAMLSTSPMDAIKHFKPEDRALVLGPLGFMASTTRGQFDGQTSTKEQIRAYVRDAMRSEETDTRKQAVVALGPVYGKDLLVGSREEGYSVNQEYLDALKEMASSDPDEELRTQAQSVLDTMDQRLKRLIRHHENPEKYKRNVK